MPSLHNEARLGIDEAGRGSIAGPVVAAAVLLPDRWCLTGLDDSKKLTPAKRKILAAQIKKIALSWGIGIIWQQRIDEINILQATFEAMAKAAAKAAAKSCRDIAMLLIDGNMTVPETILQRAWPIKERPRQLAIVRGDSKVPAISAASILAKTCRDGIMTKLDKRWPGYLFAKHKGYGTTAHYSALRRLGPCPLHRITFRGVLNSPD